MDEMEMRKVLMAFAREPGLVCRKKRSKIGWGSSETLQ